MTPMLQENPKETAAALKRHADAAFGGTQSEGAYSAKDAADLLELTVNQHIAKNAASFDPRVDADGARSAVESLIRVMSVLPTQTRRDEEMDAMQQFSTPPHLAYLAAWVASISPDDVVLEPSAGIGGLAIFGLNAGATVYVNELSERRSKLLSILPFKDRFSENAEQLNNVLPSHVKPTVILMNPPFSASVAGKKSAKVGMRHIRQALLRLQPYGRLVVIMGDGMGHWGEVASEFSIRASVGIPGKEYSKYGTRYPVRVVVIDKCKPDGESVTENADSVLDAVALLEPVRIRKEKREISVSVSKENQVEGRTAKAGVNRATPTEIAISGETAEKPDVPLGDSIFEPYHPQRLHVDGAHPHPTPLVQSAAMASVMPPVPTYAPCLPHELIETGALSEAQIEAVVYAGQAHRQMLPPVQVQHPLTREKSMVSMRKGYMVGDGTGLGKGREIAAIIMDHFARGGRQAIWVSKNRKLIKDAIRDWTDLGNSADQIVELGKFDVTKAVPRFSTPQILFVTYGLLRSGAQARITDPLDKRVRADELPGQYEYCEYVRTAFIKQANKPDHRFSYICHYLIDGGPHGGQRLDKACKAIDPEFDVEKPSKATVRKALGLPVDPIEQEPGDLSKSRLRQIIEWAGPNFDGPIIYDESHMARSAMA